MPKWEIVFYESPGGRSPVEDSLDDLTDEQADRVLRDLEFLEQLGTSLGMPNARPLVGGMWELRITGRIHHRVLYVAISGRRILVLHAFTKKTRKTPPQELRTAQTRLADWQGRYGR